jgi:translation initiation factor 2 beta subunit (eIF-2beta)/eIF-5
MKDIVIGAVTNYDYDKIKYWVNSLDRSGFDGVKAVICYNVDYGLVDELTKRNYTVLAFSQNDEKRRFEYNKNFSIVVERFFHIWHFLKKFKGQYRYIISTDMKDVVFQKNPSLWLEQNLGDKKINVACESLKYKDEEWGNHNLFKSFGPIIHDNNKDNLIFNAGTISGQFDAVLDLFLNIFMWCNTTNHYIEGGGGPDQAALNVLLNLQPYKDITRFTMSEESWAAQLGTTGPQIFEKYKSVLVEKTPIMVGDSVCSSDGTPFTIVHQYDRYSEWRKVIEKKYE